MTKPIVYNGKEYYNRKQLKELGVTDEELLTYFKLNAIKVIVPNSVYPNVLSPVADYKAYIKFKEKARFIKF